MTKAVFNDIIKDFNKKIVSKKDKVAILLDNCSAHKIDFSLYPKITPISLKPNFTCYLQPQDMSYYATIKTRYVKFRRSYVIENDEYPSDAKIFRKVVNITLDLTPEYVTCCWKMAGLCNKTNSEAEIEQVFL